jgi:hypothetical protein
VTGAAGVYSLLPEENMNETVQTPQPPQSSEPKKLKLTKERVRKDVTAANDIWPDILI